MASEPSESSSRGRGRPPGRSAFRAALRAAEDEIAPQQLQAAPHTIADARAQKDWNAMQRRESGEILESDTIERRKSFKLPLLAMGSELQQMLASAVQKLVHLQKPVQSSLQGMFHRLFRKKRHVVNLSSESETLEVARQRLRQGLFQAACFLILFTGYLLAVWFAHVAALIRSGTWKAVLLVAHRKYDETPSKISVAFKEGDKSKTESNATAKIMQTRCHISFLLKHVPSGGKRFFRCWLPTFLQAVDRTTAENTKATQDDVLGAIPNLAEMSKLFQLSVHLVCTDKYSANLKAEAFINAPAADELRNNTATAHYTCDVHKLAIVQSKALAFVNGHISAMIAGALALGEAGCLNSLRKALQAVLQDKVKVVFGNPPQDEHRDKFRKAVFDAFLPAVGHQDPESGDPAWNNIKNRVYMQRQVIAYFFNDDLQDTDVIVFWTPHWDVERDAVLESMVKFLIPCLLPHKPPLFVRSKWTGFQPAYEYFGLLAFCHGLLEPTILHFLGSEPPVKPPSVAQADAVQDATLPDAGASAPDEDPARPEARDSAGDEQIWEEVMTDNIDWKQVRVQMKSKLRLWLQSRPTAQLMVIALVTQPLQRFLHRMLFKGSKSWELNEKAKVAAGQARTFVVLESARKTDLNRFRAEVTAVFHTQVAGMPRADHVKRHQVLLFRMLSALACSVETYIHVAWRGFPIQLFAALDGNVDVQSAGKCLMDPLTRLIVNTFPNPDSGSSESLSSLECQSILQALAAEFSTEISDLESRHAATRRINTVRSVQVQRSQLVMVSADWACRCNSKNREDVFHENVSETKKQKAAEEQKAYRANSWHAFLSEKCRNRFSSDDVNMTELGQQFKSLTHEDRERYEVMASVAKLAADRNVNRPYGPRSSRPPSAPESSLVPSARQPVQEELESQLAMVKAEQRQSDQKKREVADAVRDAVASYKEDDACARVSKEVMQVSPPIISSHVPALLGMPGADVHIPTDIFGEAGW